jgi:ubiquinone/menaquinone biosynthesis C-methylase UbiE
MSNTDSPGQFDHSSDPNFYAYYTEQSASPKTRERFARVRDKALKLVAAQRGDKKATLRVLDIGCGAGTQARLWAELGHQVFGLDVNAPLIEVGRARAREEGLTVQFDVGSATNLPYGDASMDVCLMPELLEHVEDWQSCLKEAVRVLKPGGVLYLSTSNALCPKQQEFNLPLYSWYPGFVKRHYERLAVTTRPELANYARYPAVHWFTFYGLRRYLGGLGMDCLDRFDLIDVTGRTPLVKGLVWAARHVPPLGFAAHVMTEGTNVFGVKRGST